MELTQENTVMHQDMMISMRTGEVLGFEVDFTLILPFKLILMSLQTITITWML